MKNDIVFVNLLVPFNLYNQSKPIGLLSLYNCLNDVGYNAKILDFNYIYRNEKCKLQLSNNSLINSYRIAVYILSFNPQIVSIYTMCSNMNEAIQLCELLKVLDKNVITILAGPQGTALAEEILKSTSEVDLIGYGEGESTIVDIVKHLLANGLKELEHVSGIAYRDENHIFRINKQQKITDLNVLRPLKFELIDTMENIKKDAIEMEIGRGCPFACTYCSTSMFWGRNFRVKTVSKVVEEIRFYNEKYNNNMFLFHHDLLTFKKKYIMDLCNAIIEKDMIIYWACYSRLDVIDSEMIEAMSRAGCRKIYFGIESGSDKIQKIINKKLDLGKIKTILQALIKFNIFSEYSFIFGIPEETDKDLKMTLEFCGELRKMQVEMGFPDYNLLIDMHQLQFYPGTAMTKEYYDQLRYSKYEVDIRLLNPYYPIYTSKEFISRIKENKELFINYYNVPKNISKRSVLAPLFCMTIFNALYRYNAFEFVENLKKGWNILSFYNDLWEINEDKVISLVQELGFKTNLEKKVKKDILNGLTKIVKNYLEWR